MSAICLSFITIWIVCILSQNIEAKARENVKVVGTTQPPCWSRKSGEREWICVCVVRRWLNHVFLCTAYLNSNSTVKISGQIILQITTVLQIPLWEVVRISWPYLVTFGSFTRPLRDKYVLCITKDFRNHMITWKWHTIALFSVSSLSGWLSILMWKWETVLSYPTQTQWFKHCGLWWWSCSHVQVTILHKFS